MISFKHFIFAALFVLPFCLSAATLPTMPPTGYDKKGTVPDGDQKDVKYRSSVTNSDRTMVVYTPPGYSTSKKYPVVYGIHGINAWASTILDDWCCGGRYVSNNLLAEGKIEPVIIVAIDNNNIDSRRELLEVVIPYIEKNYPVIADADHRAIFGYSWGGGVAFNDGLGNLNTFHHIGPTSAAPNKAADASLFPNGGADAKQKLKTLFISCGTADWMGLFPKSEDAHKYCVTNNIPHTWLAVQGGNHDGSTWRPAMWNFLQLAFPAVTSAVKDQPASPVKNIQQTWNGPNPFTNSTTIHFTLQKQQNVNVSIFDSKGRLARTLSSDVFKSGTHAVLWDGTDSRNQRVMPGVYVYRVACGAEVYKGKMMMVNK